MSARTAHERDLSRIMDAIEEAPRCSLYGLPEGERCFGLPACRPCLILASQHILHAVGRFSLLKPLSERQRQVLDFIEQTIQTRRISPTFQEIADHMGFASLATVHEHLTHLQEKGWIRRDYNLRRAITLVREDVA